MAPLSKMLSSPPMITLYAERSNSLNANTVSALTIATAVLGKSSIYADIQKSKIVGTTTRRFAYGLDPITNAYSCAVNIIHQVPEVGGFAFHAHQVDATLKKPIICSAVGSGDFAGNNILVRVTPLATDDLNKVEVWFAPWV